MLCESVPKSVNVLLVEDDEIDVEAVRRKFRQRSITYPLHHATCGTDALDIMRGENGKQKVPKPFIILLDLNMPLMNGLEFLEEIRKDPDLCPSIVFVLTTSARESDVEAAYKANAAGYFLKDHLDRLADMLCIYGQINMFPAAARRR